MKKTITNDFFLRKGRGILCASLVLGGFMASAIGNVAYLTSEDDIPWGVGYTDPGSNEAAMDRVFGAAGWDNLSFQSADASVLFSSAYTFIFLEGGDHAALSLESFLMTNGSLIEDWVRNGGRLLINAAPNEGTGMDLGFGLTLNYNLDPESTHSADAYVVGGNPSLVSGNYGSAGGTFTGNWFSHAFVSGNGLNSLIVGEIYQWDEDGNVISGGEVSVLSELSVEEGFVLVGGMTLAHFHNDPNDGLQKKAYDLRANIIDYAAHGAIPEPSTYALWGATGLIGLVAIKRRRK